MKGRGIGGQARVLKHAIARPAFPQEITADVQIVIKALAQPVRSAMMALIELRTQVADKTNWRALLKGVLADHLQVARRQLDTEVFPGSDAVRALQVLA